MKPNIEEIFKLGMSDLVESEFRFFINRSRSVIIMNGSEFNNDVISNDTDIYMMYNDPDKNPLVLSFMSTNEIKDFVYPNYIISYRSNDRKSVTYIREDALGFLDNSDIMAADEINKPLGTNVYEIREKYNTVNT